VAAGETRPLTQHQVRIVGHAIEARLYAEDSAADFLPQSGEVVAWAPPVGPGIRMDHGLRSGLRISTFYDPMIAKVIGFGEDRDEATRRLRLALEQVMVAGLPTNRNFLLACLSQPAFAEARLSTNFIADHLADLPVLEPQPETIALAAALIYARDAERQPASLRGWRSAPWGEETIDLTCGAWSGRVGLLIARGDTYHVTIDGGAVTIHLPPHASHRRRVTIDGLNEEIVAVWSGAELFLTHRLLDVVVSEREAHSRDQESGGRSIVRAPMPGMVISINVVPQARVDKGETLLVLGAMKMELRVNAPVRGTVTAIHTTAGEQVPIRHALVDIQPG
jgi:geranyl-CoA carboxylase alpha subunit